jgi:Protein phosphatase 2C
MGAGRWRVLAATAPGAAHLRHAVDGQDAFAVAERDGLLVCAVCDGAGSAPLAAPGAAVAAALAVRIAERRFAHVPDTADRWHRDLGTLIDEVAVRFGRVAATVAEAAGPAVRSLPWRRRGADHVGDLATTLTLLLCRPPWLAVLTIGDGFVVTRSADGTLAMPVRPDPQGPMADLTTVLTSPHAARLARRHVARMPDLTGVCIGTDGLADAALEFDGSRPRAPLPGFFDPIFDWPRHRISEGPGMLARLLTSEQLERVTDDDRTLLVATWTRGEQ